ncbi:MAG: HEAT repeat domain-containing protein [Phycisphaerales bacterium]|nr:MAG: HEAT repeat domain-containing protein [Phycisphaerales bacterium]
MKKTVLLLIVLSACLAFDSQCWAWATEQCGNKPFHEVNYKDWPGIMPVVNHTTRVYQIWVNGSQNFYYKGDAAALNDCLKKFSALKVPVREVLIRPGPATTKTLEGQRIAYDWQLSIMGGISKRLTTLEGGSKIWNKHPMLIINIGDRVNLKEIHIPKGVKVIEIRDLKKRYHEGLLSSDKTVRGWGSARLAKLDAYDQENLERVIKLLNDDDEWVRLNAAGVLTYFGRKARAAIPALKECAKTANEGLKKRIEKSIKEIENSEDKADLERAHKERLLQIRNFVEALNEQKD